jgi:hypothetical protein
VVQNAKFINPGNTPPPPSVGKLTPLRPSVAVARIAPVWQRKRLNNVVPEYVPTQVRRTIIFDSDKENDCTQMPQRELLFNFYKNQAEIEKLTKQNKAMKAELKRREVEVAKQQKTKIDSLEKENQEHLDTIRIRDRTIRHLKTSSSLNI